MVAVGLILAKVPAAKEQAGASWAGSGSATYYLYPGEGWKAKRTASFSFRLSPKAHWVYDMRVTFSVDCGGKATRDWLSFPAMVVGRGRAFGYRGSFVTGSGAGLEHQSARLSGRFISRELVALNLFWRDTFGYSKVVPGHYCATRVLGTARPAPGRSRS